MEVDLSHTALLVIDCQKGFEHPTHWGHTRSNPNFESNLTALLEAFRSKQGEHSSTPIIHIYHKSADPKSPLSPDGPGVDFLSYAKPKPGEVVISKTVNSAFIGTDLEDRIRADGIRRLYIAGLTTSINPFLKDLSHRVSNSWRPDSNHCVSTTTRMAANLGVTDYTDDAGCIKKGEIILIDDGTATFNRGRWDAQTIHEVEVESLRGEFATIVRTRDVLSQLSICTSQN